MNEGRTSRSVAVAAAVNRLRLVQVESADQPGDARRQNLDQEVRQTLAGLLPNDRAAFIDELRSWFPTWEQRPDPTTPAASQPGNGGFDRAQLRDAEFLLDRLAELVPSLDSGRRQALTQRLAAAGFELPSRGGVAPAAAGEVKRPLGMNADANLDPTRAMEMLAELLRVLIDLDEVVWATWRQIAPAGGPIRRSFDFKKVVARCLSGDANTPKTTVIPGTEALRQLIAALTAAIPEAARTALMQVRKISPDAVERVVETESGGRGWNHEKRCWTKYREMSESLEKGVEAAVRKAIVDAVNDWIHGSAGR
jgi:hypothetical protein